MTHFFGTIIRSIDVWYRQKPSWLLWLKAIAWYGIITYLSHIPTSTSASTQKMVGGDDTINTIFRFCAHLGVFGLLGILVYGAMHAGQGFITQRRVFLMALCIVFLAGVLDEIHQSYVPGRFARIRDVVTDTSGAAFAVSFVLFLRKQFVENDL